MEVPKEDIEKGLRSLGLGQGDTVEVHSSLSSLGHVDGGPATVVDALMNVVGKAGGLVMSSYPLSPPLPLTEEEKAGGIGWKLRKLPEDSTERTVTGAVSDEFRRRKDVVSGTGIHRICAWGGDAQLHIKGYEHLLEVDGWVLLLGVGIDRCSSLHLGEKVPISKDFRVRLNKSEIRESNFEEVKRHYPPDIILGGSESKAGPGPWEIVGAEAEKRGLISRETIGAAVCMLFKAKQVVALYEDFRRNNPMALFPVETSTEE